MPDQTPVTTNVPDAPESAPPTDETSPPQTEPEPSPAVEQPSLWDKTKAFFATGTGRRLVEPATEGDINKIPGLEPERIAALQDRVREMQYGRQIPPEAAAKEKAGARLFDPEVMARAAAKTVTDWYSPIQQAFNLLTLGSGKLVRAAAEAHVGGDVEHASQLMARANTIGKVGTALGIPIVGHQAVNTVENWDKLSPAEKAVAVAGIAGGAIATGLAAHTAARPTTNPVTTLVEPVPATVVQSGEKVPLNETSESISKGTQPEPNPAPKLDIKPPQKNPLDMTREELGAAISEAKDSDKNLLEKLFGKDGAVEYSRVSRQQESSDPDRADAASKRVGEMEDSLTIEQQNQLYGIGETGPNLEDLKDFQKAMDYLDVDTPEALGKSLKHAVTQIGDTDVDNPPDKLSLDKKKAVIQLREAGRIADANNWPRKEVLGHAVKEAAKRFRDPEDARFMLKRFLTPPPPKESASTLVRMPRGSTDALAKTPPKSK